MVGTGSAHGVSAGRGCEERGGACGSMRGGSRAARLMRRDSYGLAATS
ncbi:hypothetical protein GLE_3295 [Lysobacter enzymogenes]|uniref:Uncharacterized protein n=1 Tax=Lysobacter enzymogenes TaxID=69 RepID=A0A0S2DJQ6_LYSEN|nr:hypothetical protein GLE_3295 [Lysobacter enzymogenes]